MKYIDFDTRIRNGFPVNVKAMIYDNAIEEVEIFTVKGKNANFITKKMSSADWDILYENIYNAQY